MPAHRSIGILVLGIVPMVVAGPATARTDGAAPSPELRVALTLAPPGSPDDGGLQARAALARQASHAAGASYVPGQRYPWTFPRSEVDRPDERSGRLIHIVYVVPAGMPDDHYDEAGVLEDSARSQNAWMKQQTGTKQWRLDTYTFTWDDPETVEVEATPVPAVDVTLIKSTKPDDALDSVGELRAELRVRKLDDANKRYIVYAAADAGGVCGSAFWTTDPQPSEFDGQYSGIYLYSSSGCRARDFATSATEPWFTETIAMQEMIHNDGMVPLTAPHTCIVSLLAYGHVCTGPLWATGADPERFDVMYPYVGLPLNEKKLDEDHLDYYGHPFPFRDLDTSPYLEDVAA